MTAYGAAHFGFVLDPSNLENRSGASNSPALIRSIEGGMLKAAVIAEGVGSQLEQIKHIGAVNPQPIRLGLGLASSKALLDWISETWALRGTKRSGRIDHGAPHQGILEGRFAQEYFGALLTEVQFPKLSADAPDDAYIQATIQPATLRALEGDKLNIGNEMSGKQLPFSTVTYRLWLGGGDDEKEGVMKPPTRIFTKSVDGISVKQHVAKMHTGRQREPELVATGIEVSDFTVTCNQSEAGLFVDWYKDRLLQPKPQDAAHDRSGYIEFLAQGNGDLVLFTIYLDNVGLYGLEMGKSESDSDDFKTVTANLYVENIRLETNDAAFED